MVNYPPHVLEIHKPEPKIASEKTIFLDPTKYKFNEKKETEPSKLEKALYWLLMG